MPPALLLIVLLIPNDPKSTTVQCATNLTFVQSATEQGNLETNHEKHSSLKLEPCPQRTRLDSLFTTCPPKPQWENFASFSTLLFKTVVTGSKFLESLLFEEFFSPINLKEIGSKFCKEIIH